MSHIKRESYHGKHLLTANAIPPGYDRQTGPRIVHRFWRVSPRPSGGIRRYSGQQNGSDWGYTEVNPDWRRAANRRSPQQDLLYTVAEMSADAWTARGRGGGATSAACPGRWSRELCFSAKMRSHRWPLSPHHYRKGYCRSPASGEMQLGSSADQGGSSGIRTSRNRQPGVVGGAAEAAGLPAFTVMS